MLVVISGDTSQLDAALAKAGTSASAFGKNAGALGSALTRSVTLPILALGGASLFMASQFQSSLARIAGLTPLLDQTGASIGEVNDAILTLASEVPTSPVDLAESLYLAGSAGLVAAKGSIEASEAFQVTELSAKAAAIGMGGAADVTKVLIAALNNFRGGGLTATAAMDVLTAAIREGTAAPDELAIALGRLLPVAEQAGATFAETAASVAALTNLGIPTRVATTSLRALFAEILAPTDQAQDALNALGLTADDVRAAFDRLGPVGAFDVIAKAVHGDEDALRDILPQLRGFTAYLGLTGDQLASYKHALDAVRHSTGDFGRAFAEIQKTPGFQFEIALNKLRVAAIKTGAAIFPIFEKIIQVIGDVADSFTNMSDPMRNVVVVIAAVAAAIGPLLKLLFNMGALSGGIISGYRAVGSTFQVMAVAIFALVGAFSSLADGSTSAFSALTSIAAGAATAFSALRLLQGAANAGLLGVNRLSVGLVGLSTGGLAAVAIGIGLVVTAIAVGLGATKRFEQAMAQAGQAMADTATSGGALRQALLQITNTDIRAELQGIARDLGIMGEAAGSSLDELQAGAADNMISAIQNLQTVAAEAGGEIRTDLVDGLQTVSPALIEAARNGESLTSVLRPLGTSVADVVKDMNDLRATSGGAEAVQQGADAVLNAIESYSAATRALGAFNLDMQTGIDLQVAGQAQVEEWAKRTGVSVDFMAQKMNEYGIVAGTANEQTFDSFLLATEGPDKMSLKMQELDAQIQETAKNIQDSIAGAFEGFDKPLKGLGPETSKLLSNFEASVHGVVDEVANLKDLAQRGVPADVLGFLADQGPQAVARFANASEGELNKLVALYQVKMAALDSEILAEALHQEGKAKSMVSNFATAMLSNSNLPPQAAAKIVKETVAAFSQGNITDKGLALAAQFARGFGQVRNLTGKQATAAMNFLIQQIQKKDLTSVGRQQAAELARGLASAANLTKAAAAKLITSITSSLDKGKQDGTDAGNDTANQYAAGLRAKAGDAGAAGTTIANRATSALGASNGPAAAAGFSVGSAFVSAIASKQDDAFSAGFAVGQAGVAGFKAGSRGSPKYATFYLGQDLVDQLNEGMRTRRFEMPFDINKELSTTLGPVGSPNHGRLNGHRPRFDHGKTKIDLDVKLDRVRAAKEIDYAVRARGDH